MSFLQEHISFIKNDQSHIEMDNFLIKDDFSFDKEIGNMAQQTGRNSVPLKGRAQFGTKDQKCQRNQYMSPLR